MIPNPTLAADTVRAKVARRPLQSGLKLCGRPEINVTITRKNAINFYAGNSYIFAEFTKYSTPHSIYSRYYIGHQKAHDGVLKEIGILESNF